MLLIEAWMVYFYTKDSFFVLIFFFTNFFLISVFLVPLFLVC